MPFRRSHRRAKLGRKRRAVAKIPKRPRKTRRSRRRRTAASHHIQGRPVDTIA